MLRFKLMIIGLILLFSGQLFPQKPDSIMICDLKIKVKKQNKIAGKVEMELDYNIKVIQDFYNNGNIKSETFCIQKATPIWIQRFFNKNGVITKTKQVNNDNYGICYALQQANKLGFLKEGAYVDYFSENNWEYPNHWFIGYDFNESKTGHETKGIVIDNEIGEIQNYYEKASGLDHL